ncbi:hypothetical protein ABT369_08665 [Dactylosporangium sp. NPDC000244]|uniref:hypothetical protein n=1 Tax=Dactylosporangium sp. NPDC000244 TaxID=3154365 RepID=UPI00331E49EA
MLTAAAVPERRVRVDLRAAAVWCAPVIALGLGLLSLRRSDVADIGSLGLVSALQPGLYVALALLTASFVVGVFRPRPAPGPLLAAHVVVLVVLLHGAAAVVEPLPRMIPSWLHVGFADYIARTGDTLPQLDARFNWPGFFALVAMATRAAGMPDAMPLLAWTAVFLNLLYCATVFRLARQLSSRARTAWLAVWLFVPANWVGQDYFGPQGMNYLFYLVLMLVLVAWFGRRRDAPPRSPGQVTGWLLRAFRLPPRALRLAPDPHPAGPVSLVGLISVVLVIFTASTVSHQLTPIAIVVSAGALVLTGCCTMRTLPILLGVVVAAYISYGTVPYWSGHLHDMFGSVGHVGGTVSSAAVQRVRGDPGHQIVVLSRLGLAAAVWGLAAVAAWRRMRRGRGDLALMSLAAAPFLLLALQSYGGEIFLRVYALALPFMVILVATLTTAGWPARRRVLTAALTGALSAVLIAAFLVARYGNEAFEQVRPGDSQAVDWLYANAPAGTSFVSLTSNVPWRAENIERYRYVPLGEDLGPASLSEIENDMRANPRGAYLVITKGQFVFAESFLGKPAGWGEGIEREVVGSGRFRPVYTTPEARIYVLAAPGGASR